MGFSGFSLTNVTRLENSRNFSEELKVSTITENGSLTWRITVTITQLLSVVSNVAQKGKTCSRSLETQNVPPSAKSCSKGFL